MAVLPQRWAWRRRQSSELPKELNRYLAVTETRALGGQVHEAEMIEPLITAIVGFFVMVFIAGQVSSELRWLGDLVIFAWLALVVRLVWRYWLWSRDLIFITDFRIIYVRGLVVRRVAMMPLVKVTDMSYNRSPMGLLLGYGQFVIESAGQDQALRTIDRVPEPDATYRYVQDLIFATGTTNVNLVNITTKKRLHVGFRGRWRADDKGGGTIEDTPDAHTW